MGRRGLHRGVRTQHTQPHPRMLCRGGGGARHASHAALGRLRGVRCVLDCVRALVVVVAVRLQHANGKDACGVLARGMCPCTLYCSV